MIQIYADKKLTYDSRLEDYDLAGLTTTTGVNKGGTASIVMPPEHPAYSRYTEYKTIVEIYRDGDLRFRGRVLYPIDDFTNQRTIVCEGELCFFQDAVVRPYVYQDAPAAVFTALVETYNSQVEPVKQFKVGTITVTDANDYIRVESESAESVLDTINKLLERCGGQIVFTTDANGDRVVNWYASTGYRSSQTIEFGANLLNFTRNGANTALATAILPYGAKDEETGQRVTIESVNDGVDYIQDDEAVALRGFIIKSVYWDDVTVPANLLKKAQAWLAQNRLIISSLELTALDLSHVDKTIDSFLVGDTIRVKSRPHRVDDDFMLTELTEDWLNPANSTITLGKDRTSLIGADVAGDDKSRNDLHTVEHQIRADYQLGIQNAITETKTTLTSLIQQTSNSILLEVSETYAENDEVKESISTQFKQLSDSFEMTFNNMQTTIDENDAAAREHIEEQRQYIRFVGGKIILGEETPDSMVLTLENDRISFAKSGSDEPFGWWDGVDFHTGNIVIEVNKRAQFGDFAFVPRSNGSLSFLKVGG